MLKVNVWTVVLLSLWMSECSTWAGQIEAPRVGAKRINCDLNFKKLRLCGSISWVKPPHSVEMMTAKDAAELMLELKPLDQAQAEIPSDLELFVKPTMPSMGGHGTEPTQVVREGASFRIREVFLSMPGEWRFRFRFKKRDRELDQAFWDYELKAGK